MLQENLPRDDFEFVLKDGTILCRLMNKIQPNSVKKFRETVTHLLTVNIPPLHCTVLQGTPFMLMENIQAFLAAAQRYGVPAEELFQTADLFERRNIPQVGIHAPAGGDIFLLTGRWWCASTPWAA